MTIQEFIKTAEEIGEGGKVRCKIDDAEINDAKLHKEDGDWFICQNEKDGLNCEDKLGYEYSWMVTKESTARNIGYIEPLKKTLRDMEAGDIIVDIDGRGAMILGAHKMYFVRSSWNIFKAFGGIYTYEQAEEYGWKLKDEEEEEIVEITAEEAIKELAKVWGVSEEKLRIKK